MGLGSEIVDFVRLDAADDVDQVAGVGQVAVVQKEARLAGLAAGDLVVGLVEEVLPCGEDQRDQARA